MLKAWLLVLCMVFSLVPTAAFAAENPAVDALDPDGDGIVNYVSIGASNVNGYGMRGYIPDSVMDEAELNWVTKTQANVLGYNNSPAGSYPREVANALDGLYDTVNLNQLGISSMRVEEVRVLLDNNYTGDSYTKWRFTGADGWFNYATGNADGLNVLRNDYQSKVAAADLITLDIGVNNVGVYVMNQISSGYTKFDSDMNLIDPDMAADFEASKAYIRELLVGYVPEFAGIMDEQEGLINTLAYAVAGYRYNFDKVVERIYELNPDVTIVVVSIQNLMAGLNITLPGMDVVLPLGDLFGKVVDMANVYIATGSPYSDKYLCADVRQDGRVEFFLDEIAAYNGDPTTLSQNIIDCFNVYDGFPGKNYDDGLHVKYQIHKFLGDSTVVGPEGKTVDGTANWANLLTMLGLSEEQRNVVITQLGLSSYDVFMAAGADGFAAVSDEALKAALKGYYDQIAVTYDRVLYTAYDVVAKIMQTGAKLDTLDMGIFEGGIGNAEDALMAAIMNELTTAVTAALADPAYVYTFPATFFDDVAAAIGVDKKVVEAVAILAVRTAVGNSFFGHPNANGHEQVKSAVMTTLAENVTGDQLVKTELQELIKVYGPVVRGILTRYAEMGAYVDPDSALFNVVISDLDTLAVLVEETPAEDLYSVVGNYFTVIMNKYKANLYGVTHGTYVKEADDYYLALGGATVHGTGLGRKDASYFDLLSDKLGVESKNYGVSALSADKLLAYVEDNAAEIAKADIITYQLDASGFMYDLLGLETVDWSLYDIDESMLEGLTADMDPTMKDLVEKAAFIAVSYAIENANAIEAIQKINPDALLVVLGMYNPLVGMTATSGGETIDIGELFEYLITVTKMYYTLYAVLDGDMVYVDVSEAEIGGLDINVNLDDTASLMGLVGKLMLANSSMHANAAGHQYIYEQLKIALPDVYTVTFDSNGGSGEMAAAATGEGAPFQLPACSFTAPANKEFSCWAIGAPDGAQVKAGRLHAFTADTTVYAVWEDIPAAAPQDSYTVTFDMSGVEAEAVEPQTVLPSGTVTEPATPVAESHAFLGWYTTADYASGTQWNFAADTVNGNITLYAKWRAFPEGDNFGGGDLWLEDIAPQPYTGKALKPEVKVYSGRTLLEMGKDYTISYKNNTNVPAENAPVSKLPTITIKFKGNYKGTISVPFTIRPIDIGSNAITADEALFAAENAKGQKPKVTLSFGTKKLGTKDVKVTYLDENRQSIDSFVGAGTWTILVEGQGNFTGTREITFTAVESTKLLAKATVTLNPKAEIYDGSAKEPAVTVKLGKAVLTEGVDYTVSYENNTAVGTAKVIVTGMGNYVGTKTATFKINGTAMSKATVTMATKAVNYTGEAITLNDYTVTMKTKEGVVTLTEGKEYTVSYSKNVAKGTATITFTGDPAYGYTGTKKATFKINACTLTAENVVVNGGETVVAPIMKGGAKPVPTIVCNGVELVAGKDYTVTYKNNTAVADETAAKVPTMTIKGKGNFAGTVTETFVIESKPLVDTTITVGDVIYNAKGLKAPTVTIVDADGKKLAAGKDYIKTVEYFYANGTPVGKTDDVPAGTVLTAKIVGMGAYTDAAEVTFRVTQASISKATFKIANQFYTGKPITIDGDDFLTAKCGTDNPLVEGEDYRIISYSKNVNKGTASVVIQGLGDYGGTKTVSFKIVEKNLATWVWSLLF